MCVRYGSDNSFGELFFLILPDMRPTFTDFENPWTKALSVAKGLEKGDTKNQLQMELGKYFLCHIEEMHKSNKWQNNMYWHMFTLWDTSLWHVLSFGFNLWALVEGIWLKRVLESSVCVHHSTWNLPNCCQQIVLIYMDYRGVLRETTHALVRHPGKAISLMVCSTTKQAICVALCCSNCVDGGLVNWA